MCPVEKDRLLINALETRLLFHCSNSSRLPPAVPFCDDYFKALTNASLTEAKLDPESIETGM